MKRYVRIIPCLDLKDGRVVKGVNFVGLRDAGDPVAVAKRYEEEGADEIILLDISATSEHRKTRVELVSSVARQLSIPVTIGGGVGSMEDARTLLEAGASKVSVNSAAVKRPELIAQLAREFGSGAVTVAIDARSSGSGWVVVTGGGAVDSRLQATEWATQAQRLGAGELLLTSMDRDGVRSGYDLALTRAVSEAVGIPVIASGGAGSLDHLVQGVREGKASALLAASVFHFGEIGVREAKEHLRRHGIPVRL